jgi:hypothetical protein
MAAMASCSTALPTAKSINAGVASDVLTWTNQACGASFSVMKCARLQK